MHKMKKILTIAILLVSHSLNAQVKGSFTDTRDGKVYKTVKIGTQTWMAENLAYKATSGCWVYENTEGNAAIYGYLYNWETAKKSCPSGWHLPSDSEWEILSSYFKGGGNYAGGKLKEIGTTHWYNPNSEATNESGFTALPGGNYYEGSKGFGGIGERGIWWTSSICPNFGQNYSWSRALYFNYGTGASNTPEDVTNGYSVRCVKD